MFLECDQINGCMLVNKNGQGVKCVMIIYEYELLVEQFLKKQMLFYKVWVWLWLVEEFDGWVCYDGEEFFYVLIGVVKFYIEFYELIEMCCGDSVYYDVMMGYNVVLVS